MALTRADAAHLLRRTGFAPTAAEITSLTGLSRSAAVTRVLDRSAAPATPRPPQMDSGEDWVVHTNMIDWWLERMRSTPTPIVERMTLFWHNHFATGQEKVQTFEAMWEQHLILRNGAFGNFADLVKQVSVSKAMLLWLDNAVNVVGGVQENFGRELMELFTCGVGNYTESDVVAVARAWTGHNLSKWNGSILDQTYQFKPHEHDNGMKTLFGKTRNWDGPDTIDELCYGSRAQATSRFIAKKLFEYFGRVDPPASVVNDLGATFVSSGMNIHALLRAVLLHDEFWAPASRRALVKWPVDYVVDICRTTGYSIEDSAPRWIMQPMGQILFDPPDVSGWKHNEYWLSTATAWGRQEYVSNIRWAIEDLGFFDTVNDQGRSVAQVVDDALREFRIEDVSIETRDRLRGFVTECRARFPWFAKYGLFVLIALSPEFQTK